MLATIERRFFVVSLTLVVITGGATMGCCWPRSGSSISNVRTLGSVLDEVNLRQEENAELAKFTIYMHEFEVNSPPVEDDPSETKDGVVNQGIRGFQLTPSGKDHVRQIARQLILMANADGGQSPTTRVVVERSNTSKLASTVYQYPIHYNAELDAVRRQMVISALQGLGVDWADSCVVVGPAFSTGMSANESAETYRGA